MGSVIGLPKTHTGRQFRTVTSFYHRPLEFAYAVAEPELGGGRYEFKPGESKVMTSEIAEACIERFEQYGVLDTSDDEIPGKAYRERALRARLTWLMNHWRFVLATIENAKRSGMLPTPAEDLRPFFQAELDWVNKELGEKHVYPSIETPAQATIDAQKLQSEVENLRAQLTMLLGAQNEKSGKRA